jgi:O-phosphoseryl-tRNA(Cys) synthetase
MKDEIKEILNDLLFTTTLPNVSVKLSKEKLNQLKDCITKLEQENEELKERINKILEMFESKNLNNYYYGMSYEFEINDFKEDILNILGGDEE